MKRIPAIALFAIANLALAGTSLAQSNGVQAAIPFAFTVGTEVLPAGTYSINKASSGVVMIRNNDRNKSASALSLVHEDDKKSPTGGKLVFHRIAGQYFLNEILCDAASMNVELPTSRKEKAAMLEEAKVGTNNQTLVATR